MEAGLTYQAGSANAPASAAPKKKAQPRASKASKAPATCRVSVADIKSIIGSLVKAAEGDSLEQAVAVANRYGIASVCDHEGQLCGVVLTLQRYDELMAKEGEVE